jgi:hypothetical protein
LDISGHYRDIITEITNELHQLDIQYIVNVKTQELVEYFVDKYSLSEIRQQGNLKTHISQAPVGTPILKYSIFCPIELKERIELTIQYRADFYNDLSRISISGNYLTVHATVDMTLSDGDKCIETYIT